MSKIKNKNTTSRFLPVMKRKDSPAGLSFLRRGFFLPFIIFVFLFSTFFAAFSPVIENSSAATKLSSITDRALSHLYLTSLMSCVKNKSINDNNAWDGKELYSPGSASSGDWFWKDDWSVVTPKGPDYAHASYIVDGVKTDTGEVLCNDIVKKASKLWGYNSPLDLLCSFVDKRANGSSCKTGNGDFGKDELIGHQDALKKAVIDKVYDGKAPAFSSDDGGAQLYLIYAAAFFKGCEAKKSSSPASDFKYTVTTVDDKGNLVKDTVYEGLKHDVTRWTYTMSDLTELQQSCETIAAKVNEYAPKYAAFMKANVNNPDENANPGCVTNPTAQGCSGSDGTNSDDGTSCNIESVGWLVCPVLTFGAKLADGSYKFLSDNFLSINTGLLNTNPDATTRNDDGTLVKTGNGTFIAWGIIRNIANVAFVIVFLIVIFSQLTGMGVSNYGVKKLLPRLIVGAILVNLSFYICQAAVDISNVLGYSLKELLSGVAKQITSAGAGTAVPVGDDSGNLFGIITTILTAGALLYFNLAAAVLAVVAGIVVLLTIFVLLIARQALIVLLIALAPLAFVAFLLPNTEPLFQKWRKLFTSLLLLFPIIGLLYGASLLASAVLLQVAGKNTVMQLAAYLALVLPLIAVIPLLKGSLNAIPAIGNAIQRLGKKAEGTAQGTAKKAYDKSRLGQFANYRAGVRARRNAQIMGGSYEGKGGNLNPRNLRSKANSAINDISGGFGAHMSAAGIALSNKEQAEDIAATEQKLRRELLTDSKAASTALVTALKKGDVIGAKAAQNVLFSQGGSGVGKFFDAVQSAGGAAQEGTLNALRENINEKHGQYIKSKAADLTSWAGRGGTIGGSEHLAALSGLSESDLASQTSATMKRAQNSINPVTARSLLNNKQLSGNLDPDQREILEKVVAGGVGQAAAQQSQTQTQTDQQNALSAAQRARDTASRAAEGTSGDGIFTVEHGGDVTHSNQQTPPTDNQQPPTQPPVA